MYFYSISCKTAISKLFLKRGQKNGKYKRNKKIYQNQRLYGTIFPNKGILQMASKTNIIKKLTALFSELEKDNIIEIKSAYLFGSVVKGKRTKYSDIDLAIVSDSFTGYRYDDRVKLNPYILKIDTSVEIHPFTTSEFKIDNPFAKEIMETGQRIF
jgi:uncharacterized protein